jgi:energy-coupling factor transporter ATP-binding protein EcfA2
VYEPELRVKIQEEDPSESETYAKVNSFAINFPNDLKIKDESGEKTDFCLNGTYSLELSNNLTCFIGGRGSGKSTLAHIVYNSWINNDPKKLNSINSPLLNLEMQPSPLNKVSECTDCDVPSQTEFFFQNEIEHAAKNIASMSSLIRNRLLRLSSIDGGETLYELQGAWDTSSDSVNELVDAYDRITMIEDKVFKAKENINTLKKQTEIIKSNEYKDFQTKIGELTSSISEFKSYKTDFENLIKQIESLSATIDQLNWTDDQGKAILASLHQTLASQKDQLQATFTKSNIDYNTEDFPGQLKKREQDLSVYLKDRGLSPENVQELTQANTKIKEYEEQIRLAQIDKKPYDQVYAKKTQTIEAYNTLYEAYKTRFRFVTLSLQERLAGLSMSEKEITFSLEIDFSHLKNGLVEFVKENIEDDISLRSDAIERLLFEGTDISTLVQNKISFRNHLSRSTKAEKHRLIIQELINKDVFLERFHLRMLKNFFDIHNIHVQTKMGGKLLKNTSFGERCGIVIAIVLVAGTNPIVIDQPEDHLDGRFISDVLVPLLRLQKYNRQIILITRDANIVVGGDAELIQILESTDERTEVLPSSIENIDRREKYIWILDGGTDAFARREQKYDIELLRSHSRSNS